MAADQSQTTIVHTGPSFSPAPVCSNVFLMVKTRSELCVFVLRNVVPMQYCRALSKWFAFNAKQRHLAPHLCLFELCFKAPQFNPAITPHFNPAGLVVDYFI